MLFPRSIIYSNIHKCITESILFPGYESSNDKETIGRSTPRLQPAKRDQITGAVSRSNRFGFRQNTVRPASVGLTPKINDFDNVNNNTSAAIADAADKRRSKSASATARTTISTLPHNPQPPVKLNLRTTNLTYQQQQANTQLSEIKPFTEKCNVVRTDLHSNAM